MDKIYFRYNFKIYVGHFTRNRPNQCSLWQFCLKTGNIEYLGYYNGTGVEPNNELRDASWETYRCAKELYERVIKPFVKRSIPGVRQIFA